MPCYVFTYHGRGTWMPDHRRGYVRRGKGVQQADPAMADAYRAKMRDSVVEFTAEVQRAIVNAAHQAGTHLNAVIHGIATEPTHVHIQMSWKRDRAWKSMRASLRSGLSRSLNTSFGKQDWFADAPSRKRIGDYEHFDYWLLVYLPKHRGIAWRRDVDLEAAERRDAQRSVSVRQRKRRR